MPKLWRTVSGFIDEHLGVSPNILAVILGTLLVIVLYVVIRYVIVRIATRRIEDVARRYVTTKVINYVLGLLALLALAKIWLGGATAGGIATYLGIVSAGIAIALRDPLTNLVGWVYIVTRKPLAVGDRIEIGEHTGDVIDISLFHFSLVEIGKWVAADQSTGRIIHVPNGWVFSKSTCNYTQGFNFIWNELPVTVTFESNWEKAKEILTRIASEHSAVKSEAAERQVRRAAQKFMIFFQHLTPIVWTSVAAHGITLTMRYLAEPRNRRTSASRMWEEVLREFAKSPDIDFAYPTQRFYNNLLEGKEHRQSASDKSQQARADASDTTPNEDQLP